MSNVSLGGRACLFVYLEWSWIFDCVNDWFRELFGDEGVVLLGVVELNLSFWNVF